MTTRREKLLAVINPKSGATEGERNNAKSLLARLDAKAAAEKAAYAQTPLSREQILKAADDLAATAKAYDVSMEDLRAATQYAAAEMARNRKATEARAAASGVCPYCGQTVNQNILARHMARCPSSGTPRYQDGVRTGRGQARATYEGQPFFTSTAGSDNPFYDAWAGGRPRDGARVSHIIFDEFRKEGFDPAGPAPDMTFKVRMTYGADGKPVIDEFTRVWFDPETKDMSDGS